MVMTARSRQASQPTASRGLDAESGPDLSRTKKTQAADCDTQVGIEGMQHAGSVQQQMSCRGNFGRRTAANFFLVGSRNLVGSSTSSESTATKNMERQDRAQSGCRSGQEASNTPRQARHRSSEREQQQPFWTAFFSFLSRFSARPAFWPLLACNVRHKSIRRSCRYRQ